MKMMDSSTSFSAAESATFLSAYDLGREIIQLDRPPEKLSANVWSGLRDDLDDLVTEIHPNSFFVLQRTLTELQDCGVAIAPIPQAELDELYVRTFHRSHPLPEGTKPISLSDEYRKWSHLVAHFHNIAATGLAESPCRNWFHCGSELGRCMTDSRPWLLNHLKDSFRDLPKAFCANTEDAWMDGIRNWLMRLADFHFLRPSLLDRLKDSLRDLPETFCANTEDAVMEGIRNWLTCLADFDLSRPSLLNRLKDSLRDLPKAFFAHTEDALMDDIRNWLTCLADFDFEAKGIEGWLREAPCEDFSELWADEIPEVKDYQSLIDHIDSDITFLICNSPAEKLRPGVNGRKTDPTKADDWWHDRPPGKDDRFFDQCLTGEKQQIAQWAGYDERTLESMARGGGFWIWKKHRTEYKLYFKTEGEYTTAAARAKKSAKQAKKPAKRVKKAANRVKKPTAPAKQRDDDPATPKGE